MIYLLEHENEESEKVCSFGKVLINLVFIAEDFNKKRKSLSKLISSLLVQAHFKYLFKKERDKTCKKIYVEIRIMIHEVYGWSR